MNKKQKADKFEGFDWDEGNIDKNFIRHGISNKESEEIFFNPRLSYPDSKHSLNETRYIILGKTDAGQILSASFTLRGSKIRIISSRPVNKKEKLDYEKAFKEDS
jgi:uncharacterized DUF497 family protein